MNIGDNVQVYNKDKWRPAKLNETGRKWCKVTIGTNDHQSKVLMTSIRPLVTVATPKVVLEQSVGLWIVEDEHYVKLKDGTVTLGLFVLKFKTEALIAFEAIKKARES